MLVAIGRNSAASHDPGIKSRTTTMGFRMFGGAPEVLAAYLKAEIAKWAEVAKRAGMLAK